MYFRKTSSKIILFLLVVLVVSVIVGIIFTTVQNHKGNTPNNEPSSGSDVVLNEAADNSNVNLQQSNELKKISYDVDYALVGRMGYSDSKKELGLEDQELYQLEPMLSADTGEEIKIATGHTLYQSKENGNMYIISGETPVGYTNGKIMPLKFLREEDTGARIRTFNNLSELEAFNRSWQAGQRLLSGETVADSGSVIIDGCLTDVKFEMVNGDVKFNILDAMKKIVPDSYYTQGEGFFYVFMDGLETERIPTTSIPYVYESYDVSPITNMYTFKGVLDGEPFEYRASLIDEQDMMVCGKDIHVILGWEFYTNGNIMSIVTAPENVTGNGVVYSFTGNSGYITKIIDNGDGSYSINTYDTAGNLISSEPYNISLEENQEITDLESDAPSDSSTDTLLPESDMANNQSEDANSDSSYGYFSDDDIVV